MTVSVFLRYVVLPATVGAGAVFGLLWLVGRVVNCEPIEWLDDRLARRRAP